jgi:hypothetical protein
MSLQLKSVDGEIFPLPLELCQRFGTLRSMIEDLGEDQINTTEVIPLPKVNSRALKTLISLVTNHSEGSGAKHTSRQNYKTH